MDELRAALAVARKDIRNVSRYRLSVAASIFTPLYQAVLPALLFGASFAVGGRVIGLEESSGTADLSGFIFLGGVVSGLVATAFWVMAMSFRNEMETGTLQPTWLTPTARETLVIGRALGGLFWFAIGQAVILGIGVALFGLRFRAEALLALPALAIAVVGLVGIAYALAAVVLTIRDANLFIDCTNFLFATASGVAFPVLLLPDVVRPVAYLLPTTYAMDLLRHEALGTRPLFDPLLEHAALLATALVALPLGRAAFRAADARIRSRGTLDQY
jgi:ABC-2 type transport system permease protein